MHVECASRQAFMESLRTTYTMQSCNRWHMREAVADFDADGRRRAIAVLLPAHAPLRESLSTTRAVILPRVKKLGWAAASVSSQVHGCVHAASNSTASTDLSAMGYVIGGFVGGQ